MLVDNVCTNCCLYFRDVMWCYMLLLFEADHKCIPADVEEDNRVVDVEADVPDLNCDPV